MCAAVLGPELVVELLLRVTAVQPVLGYRNQMGKRQR